MAADYKWEDVTDNQLINVPATAPIRSKPKLSVITSLPIAPSKRLETHAINQTHLDDVSQPQHIPIYQHTPKLHPFFLNAKSAPLLNHHPVQLPSLNLHPSISTSNESNTNFQIAHEPIHQLKHSPPPRPQNSFANHRRRLSEKAKDLLTLTHFRRPSNSSINSVITENNKWKSSKSQDQIINEDDHLPLDRINIHSIEKEGLNENDSKRDNIDQYQYLEIPIQPERPYRSPGTASFFVTNQFSSNLDPIQNQIQSQDQDQDQDQDQNQNQRQNRPISSNTIKSFYYDDTILQDGLEEEVKDVREVTIVEAKVISFKPTAKGHNRSNSGAGILDLTKRRHMLRDEDVYEVDDDVADVDPNLTVESINNYMETSSIIASSLQVEVSHFSDDEDEDEDEDNNDNEDAKSEDSESTIYVLDSEQSYIQRRVIKKEADDNVDNDNDNDDDDGTVKCGKSVYGVLSMERGSFGRFDSVEDVNVHWGVIRGVSLPVLD